MALTRTIYPTSKCLINGSGILTQSVNFRVNKPKQTINEFGSLNSYRQTNDPEVATLDVTFYPTGGEGGIFSFLKGQSEAESPIRAVIHTNLGNLNSAMLTALRGTAAVGSVPNMTASFIGAFDAPTAPVTPSNSPITNVKTTESITINNDAGINAQRFNFSWEIPVLPVLAYDESLANPTGFFGNPPGVCSFELEGINNLPNINSVQFGNFNLAVLSGVITASGANLAVGQIAMSHSLTMETSASNVSFS